MGYCETLLGVPLLLQARSSVAFGCLFRSVVVRWLNDFRNLASTFLRNKKLSLQFMLLRYIACTNNSGNLNILLRGPREPFPYLSLMLALS